MKFVTVTASIVSLGRQWTKPVLWLVAFGFLAAAILKVSSDVDLLAGYVLDHHERLAELDTDTYDHRVFRHIDELIGCACFATMVRARSTTTRLGATTRGSIRCRPHFCASSFDTWMNGMNEEEE